MRQWARSGPHRFSVPLPFWCPSWPCGASGLESCKTYHGAMEVVGVPFNRPKSEIFPLVLLGWFPVYWEIRKRYLYIICTYIYIYYIYTVGAGGSPKVLGLGYCECSEIVISLWWNVSFWRSHSLHRMVFCADEIFLIRALIDQKIHPSYIYTCEKRVICVVKWRFWKCYDGPSVQKCCGPQYFWR